MKALIIFQQLCASFACVLIMLALYINDLSGYDFGFYEDDGIICRWQEVCLRASTDCYHYSDCIENMWCPEQSGIIWFSFVLVCLASSIAFITISCSKPKQICIKHFCLGLCIISCLTANLTWILENTHKVSATHFTCYDQSDTSVYYGFSSVSIWVVLLIHVFIVLLDVNDCYTCIFEDYS